MDVAGFVSRARRALRKPPRVLAARAWTELNGELDRIRAPRRDRGLDERALLRATGSTSIEELWDRACGRTLFVDVDAEDLERLAPGEIDRVQSGAEDVLARRVRLLGAQTALGSPVGWDTDFRSGRSWPNAYWRSIRYVDPTDDSDVKVPWELSRLQWALPAAQAYVVTGDERYAAHVRALIEDWIAANPYAHSVNWAVTMEVALRILSWGWLLGALGGSQSWGDEEFRLRFLRALYLHGDFTSRNLERSDVNGNHYTADAVGLHAAGLVLGVDRWTDEGWRILEHELPLQVYPDGVDFEASAAYHRLVGELFFLAALQRDRLRLEVSDEYRSRVRAMAAFTAAYTRPDGTAPRWGDADDARALPLGGADVNDHRHLIGAVAAAWSDSELGARFSGTRAEIAWLLGTRVAAVLPDHAVEAASQGFGDGGVYILADAQNHVFVDCGRVGLADRGGHGHNDCLSFEAFLAGEPVVLDPGTYVYTASTEWRNYFRSTVAHNTPRVDGREQATLDPSLPWTLGAEARGELLELTPKEFRGTHGGYGEVRPIRTITLDHGRLVVADAFEGSGDHEVEVPLQLAPHIRVTMTAAGAELEAGSRRYTLSWADPADWQVALRDRWVSPSYGVRTRAPRLEWTRKGTLVPLRVEIVPL